MSFIYIIQFEKSKCESRLRELLSWTAQSLGPKSQGNTLTSSPQHLPMDLTIYRSHSNPNSTSESSVAP